MLPQNEWNFGQIFNTLILRSFHSNWLGDPCNKVSRVPRYRPDHPTHRRCRRHLARPDSIAVIRGVTTLPLVGDFEMVIDGQRLTYIRPVHVADQPSLSGVQERGTGVLTGKAIKLQGGASGQGYSYTSAYQGQLDGGGASLNGEQIWTSAKSPSPFHRSCQITLNR